MKTQIRANYDNENKVGSIRISKIVGNKPIEYILDLFENTGIKINKNKFASVSAAIAHASQYGFIATLWTTEEMDI